MLFILILLLSLVAQFFLPWWVIAPIAFILAVRLGQNGKKSFWNGFSALFILWACMALLRTLPNENLLANRVGQMLTLPESGFNWIILVFISSLIGGLVAGLSAFAGFQFKEAFLKKR
ncbi:MAG: hypothetical protein ACKOW2_02070 [Sphingobacteriaceae bacterium]